MEGGVSELTGMKGEGVNGFGGVLMESREWREEEYLVQ